MDNQLTVIADCYLTVEGQQYAVSAFSCTYEVNTLPTCSLSMSFGWSLKDGPNTKSGDDFIKSLNLDSKETEAELYLQIDGEDKKIFHGIILSAGYATAVNAIGSSQMQVQVVLQHIAGKLFTLSLTDFSYMPADMGLYKSFSQIKNERYKAATNQMWSETSLTNSISSISLLYVDQAKELDVVAVIKQMLYKIHNIMEDVRAGQQGGDRSGNIRPVPYINDLIKGSVKLSSDIPQKFPYVQLLCTEYAQMVAKQDALSAIMNILPSSDFLLQLIPSSPDYVTIAPTTIFIGDPEKAIGRDTVYTVSMNVEMSMDVRGADTVVICSTSASMFDANPSASDTILAIYPDPKKDYAAVKKVMALPAPLWVAGQGRNPSKSTKNKDAHIKAGPVAPVRNAPEEIVSITAVTGVAEEYARLMYLNHLYGGSSVNVKMLSKSPITGEYSGIDDLKYLGRQVSINVQPNTEVNPVTSFSTLIGTFSRMSINYTGAPGRSSLDILYGFDSIHTQEAHDKFMINRNPIYDETRTN